MWAFLMSTNVNMWSDMFKEIAGQRLEGEFETPIYCEEWGWEG